MAVKGLQAECGRVGYNLTAMQQLRPASLEVIMELAQPQQQQREAAVTDICPRTILWCSGGAQYGDSAHGRQQR